MARVRRLGELDWDYTSLAEEEPCLARFLTRFREGPLISLMPDQQESPETRILGSLRAASSPVEINAQGEVLRLSFLLSLDEPVWMNAFGQKEKGGFSKYDAGWECMMENKYDIINLPESELTLPCPIRRLLERVYYHLSAFVLIYDWDGQENLRVDVCFDIPQCHLKITYFSRFLESLAKKMSKWY